MKNLLKRNIFKAGRLKFKGIPATITDFFQLFSNEGISAVLKSYFRTFYLQNR